MSIINCDICDRYVDTDFNAEGIWPSFDHDDMTKPDYICEGCIGKLSLRDLTKLGYDEDKEIFKHVIL